MKYLFINSVYGIGSTGKLIHEKCHELIKKGNECAVAFGRRSITDQKVELYKIGTQMDIYYHVGITRFVDQHGFASKRATKKLIQWIAAYDPDIVWMHNLHGYYINIEILFEWLKQNERIKKIWTLHDCWAFTGHCAHFTSEECDKWKTVCYKCPLKREYPSSIGIDRSRDNYIRKMKAFTGVQNLTLITPSEWLARVVKDSYLKEYPVKIMNNTVDKEIFKPTKSNFRKQYNLQGKIVVLGVANIWTKNKGLDDFCKLSILLDERYKIVLVGISNRQEKKLPSSILCIPRTQSAEELVQIYSAADVFVNPTHEDTYPTVNLEARACGVPVITYNVGGSPESAGWKNIVDHNDIVGLVKKIDEITTVRRGE